MPKTIALHSDRCIGCRSCEVVCSLVNDGEINPARSRIAIITFLETKDALPFHFIGHCRQCQDAPCLSACPVEAVHRYADETNRVMVNHDICIGCGKCVGACPFGVMRFDSVTKKAYKCELCNGEPACVDICPSGALEYREQPPAYARIFDFQMQGHMYLSGQNKENIRKKRPKPTEPAP